MGDIELEIEPHSISQDTEIRGTVSVSYPGRYDGVVVNTQILDSNEHVSYESCNGRLAAKITRLFIDRKAMPGNKAEFTARISFEPKHSHEVKFRASIIEQHKEIDSKIVFAQYG